MVKRKRSQPTSQEKSLEKQRTSTIRGKKALHSNFTDPDPESREYVYDEIDNYHATDDKILLDSYNDGPVDSEKYESVLPLYNDEDSDESSENEYGDYYARMAQKDEMASDIEGEDDEDDLPDAKAWGKKKELYYSTDYVDQDYGGYHGSDVEMAEEEEKEALAIQKRMLQEFDEEDFGVEWLKPKEPEKLEVEIKEKITLDLSKLSKSEKLELLKKESPECLELIEDYIFYMTEIKERIQPLYDLCQEGKIPLGPGTDFIKLKHQLIFIYCTNISFYLVLKCRGTSVVNHPVLKRLATYKKLLQQLGTAEQKITSQLDIILEKVAKGKKLEFKEALPKKEKLKLRIMKNLEQKNKAKLEEPAIKELRSKKVKILETQDEKDALKMYEMLKAGRKDLSEIDEVEHSEDEEDQNNEDEIPNDILVDGEEEESLEKRGITYQIAKNKGLTPHRKKEYRNPRVKHRMKFRKAKINRKGQVKEPRKELQRYGGEVSGIRIGVKHGIKLK